VPLVRLVREACRRGADRELLARAAALCTTAGGWLRTFQQAGTARLGNARSEQLGDAGRFPGVCRRTLARPARAASGHRAQPARAASGTRCRHAARLAAIQLRPVTWSHSDFGAHNLLADGDKLHVLDFELAPQHPYFDVAYFVEALDHLHGPRIDASRVARLERAFLSGWGGQIDVSLLALFRLRHLVCAYVSEARRGGMAQLRGWPGLLGMRARLRQLPLLLAQRPGTRAA
jgi:aminoglycoside phosphotransferase (APT) family kinase protein